MDPLAIYTLEAFHMRCQRQILHNTVVGSRLQWRGAPEIWFVNHWWHPIVSSLFGRVARLDPGLPAHDAPLRLTVNTSTKAESKTGNVLQDPLPTGSRLHASDTETPPPAYTYWKYVCLHDPSSACNYHLSAVILAVQANKQVQVKNCIAHLCVGSIPT